MTLTPQMKTVFFCKVCKGTDIEYVTTAHVNMNNGNTKVDKSGSPLHYWCPDCEEETTEVGERLRGLL